MTREDDLQMQLMSEQQKVELLTKRVITQQEVIIEVVNFLMLSGQHELVQRIRRALDKYIE